MARLLDEIGPQSALQKKWHHSELLGEIAEHPHEAIAACDCGLMLTIQQSTQCIVIRKFPPKTCRRTIIQMRTNYSTESKAIADEVISAELSRITSLR